MGQSRGDTKAAAEACRTDEKAVHVYAMLAQRQERLSEAATSLRGIYSGAHLARHHFTGSLVAMHSMRRDRC